MYEDFEHIRGDNVNGKRLQLRLFGRKQSISMTTYVAVIFKVQNKMNRIDMSNCQFLIR